MVLSYEFMRARLRRMHVEHAAKECGISRRRRGQRASHRVVSRTGGSLCLLASVCGMPVYYYSIISCNILYEYTYAINCSR
jgi:hypothetical protein